jgi:putative ABC transport system substrate-binding protein
MKRREFITWLGGAATAWPLAARAQPVKTPIRVGLLPLGSPSNAYDQSLVEAFRQGLRQAGLVEKRDVVLDVAWLIGNAEQAVDQLIQRGAEVLVPCGTSASVAAKQRTSTRCSISRLGRARARTRLARTMPIRTGARGLEQSR